VVILYYNKLANVDRGNEIDLGPQPLRLEVAIITTTPNTIFHRTGKPLAQRYDRRGSGAILRSTGCQGYTADSSTRVFTYYIVGIITLRYNLNSNIVPISGSKEDLSYIFKIIARSKKLK